MTPIKSIPFALAAVAATCGSQAAAQETDSDEAEVAAQRPEGGPPAGFDMSDSVFDETWLTFGVGVGLTPSYSGSDDYRAFPLPLIVGRIGGVGITPNGPGLNFDVLSSPPGQDQGKTSLSFGPTVRFRGSRDDASQQRHSRHRQCIDNSRYVFSSVIPQ